MGDCDNGFDEMKLKKKVREIEEQFWLSKEVLMQVADDIEVMMQKGLKDQDSSFIKMLVSYVDSLPTGDEEGCFYALDLGGTNLRVMQVKLQGNRTIDLKSQSYTVPHKLKVGKLNVSILMQRSVCWFQELFDYIVDKVSIFIDKEEDDPKFKLLPGQKRELGFTFSFPVYQTRINSGTLLSWTKDYDIKEAIGKDMVEELTKALERRNLDMNVTALELPTSVMKQLNDTVGTLAGGRFYDSNVVAAVILGTGMNAAYVEKTENILKPYGVPPKSGQMVINTEWGNFNSSRLPLTVFDRALDDNSSNRGKQVLEKMLSGRYLGEIVRRILLWLAENAALFGDTIPPKLHEHYILGTDAVSAMHGDYSSDLDLVGECLEEILEITNISLEKKQLIVKICEMVATRGARLSAATILAILKRLGKDTASECETVVAVDGALFGKYQQFKSCLHRTLSEELLEEPVSKKVVLRQYKDASGIGAALVAASHSIYRHI
ncbi:hypothetical protein Cgig2_018021 [Carnegiea gigantea]|uniref:Phosphotransferase n=1 Tax=Carnegiea gigantea TaxID=171969 RepID=A0A9Q1JZ57_9CARY|nr:hypothetical protein Cgig2_018021 [Carnegiea gigantea]